MAGAGSVRMGPCERERKAARPRSAGIIMARTLAGFVAEGRGSTRWRGLGARVSGG